MEVSAKEIALEIVHARSEVLEPMYEELRQQLLGSVASQHFIDRQQELAHNFANAALVKSIVDMLPDSPTQNAIEVSSVPEARQVQANAVWFSPRFISNENRTHIAPYYIVGQRNYQEPKLQKGKPVRELMVHPTKSGPPHPLLVRVNSSDMEAREVQLRRDLAEKEYTRAEIDHMFTAPSGNLRLGPLLETPLSAFPTYAPRRGPGLDVIRTHCRKPQPGAIRLDSGQYMARWKILKEGISDAQLASFEVFKHLGDLASAFKLAAHAEQQIADYLVHDDVDASIL